MAATARSDAAAPALAGGGAAAPATAQAENFIGATVQQWLQQRIDGSVILLSVLSLWMGIDGG